MPAAPRGTKLPRTTTGCFPAASPGTFSPRRAPPLPAAPRAQESGTPWLSRMQRGQGPRDTPLRTYLVQAVPRMPPQHPALLRRRGGGWQNWGRKRGGGGKQREDRTEEHTKGGRRRARSRVTWRSPEEAPEPSLPQKHLDGIMAASGSASGGSWPLSAHPTCVRGLPGSPRPLSCSHLSCRCPGFARTWRSPKLQPCTLGVGYSLGDGASGLGVPGSTETDPPPAMNPR